MSQISVASVKPGMIIDDGWEKVIVEEVVPPASVGLGIVIKGLTIAKAVGYAKRFMDPDELVTRIQKEEVDGPE